MAWVREVQMVADRLSRRPYLDYDPSEPLPDHSSLDRIRERHRLEVCRRFVEAGEAGIRPTGPS